MKDKTKNNKTESRIGLQDISDIVPRLLIIGLISLMILMCISAYTNVLYSRELLREMKIFGATLEDNYDAKLVIPIDIVDKEGKVVKEIKFEKDNWGTFVSAVGGLYMEENPDGTLRVRAIGVDDEIRITSTDEKITDRDIILKLYDIVKEGKNSRRRDPLIMWAVMTSIVAVISITTVKN